MGQHIAAHGLHSPCPWSIQAIKIGRTAWGAWVVASRQGDGHLHVHRGCSELVVAVRRWLLISQQHRRLPPSTPHLTAYRTPFLNPVRSPCPFAVLPAVSLHCPPPCLSLFATACRSNRIRAHLGVEPRHAQCFCALAYGFSFPFCG